MLALRARYVFPIDSPPIRDGVVAIDHDRIVAVGQSSSAAIRDLLPAARDLGDVAILPGLINSHTHLEFSNLPQPLGEPGMPFADWIRFVVRSRHERLAVSQADPMVRGITESIEHGVTALGEIASTPWQGNESLPLEITEFCEVICFHRDRDQTRYHTAVAAVDDASQNPPIRWTDMLRPGISPHTPFTVRPELVQQCVQLSSTRQIPLTLHLAETREELELLRSGSGPLVDMMQEFSQWEATEIKPNTRPLELFKNAQSCPSGAGDPRQLFGRRRNQFPSRAR